MVNNHLMWPPVCSATLLLSVALLIPFDPSIGTPQLVEFTPWVSRIGLDYRLAVDGLSLPLISSAPWLPTQAL